MTITKSSLAFAMSAVLLSGCSYRLGSFTALSSKNVPIKYGAQTSTRGEACKMTAIFIPPLLPLIVIPLPPPSLEDAVDQAIGRNGNALVNQVTYTSGYFVGVGVYQCYEVKGDVVTIE